jgi:hypothetical protein
MEQTYVTELMTVERLLLEIDSRFKFELTLNDSLRLYNYLKKVGNVTNFFFYIQDEFSRKYPDKEKVKDYNRKLMSEKIEFDLFEIEEFIDYVYETFGDDDFRDIVSKNRFWHN